MGLKALFKELTGKKPDLADYRTLRSNTYFCDIRTELGRMSTIQAVATRNDKGNWDVAYQAMRSIRGVRLHEDVENWKNVSTKEMEKLMENFEEAHGGHRPANRFTSSFHRVMKPAA